MTLLQKIESVRQEAIEKIKRNGSQVLYDEAKHDLYDLPHHHDTDKYGNYNQFAIVSYFVDGDDIVFKGKDVEEVFEERDFHVAELDTDSLAYIADEWI